jgi:hypothetical protein
VATIGFNQFILQLQVVDAVGTSLAVVEKVCPVDDPNSFMNAPRNLFSHHKAEPKLFHLDRRIDKIAAQ